jgi:cell division septal protein FtsQ
MFGTKDGKRRKKLRQQPKLRRVEAGSILSMPRLEIPRTARKRRRRNKGWLRLPTAALRQIIFSSRWVSLFLLVLCTFSLVLIGMDEGFYLTKIPVEGVASIPPSEVVNASGLAGAHIFAVDPGEAAERIGSVPGVISATVTLEWPNSALIRIGEESPVAVWEQGDRQYWINDSGQLVPARVDVPGLLHIRAQGTASDEAAVAAKAMPSTAEEEDAEEDAAAASRAPYVPEAVVAGALQLRELRPNIDVLHYDISGGLSYEDGRGWRVYFGTGTDMAQKLVVYETLVEHLLDRGVRPAYISVSNQEKPFYMAGGS